MRRSYLLFLVLLLLSGCLLFSRIYQFQVEAPTSYSVHNINTGLNYTTIQEAIDANETLDENIILVDAGIYYEAVTVDKSISLVGTDRNAAIIDGNFTIGDLVTVTVDNVKISNLTIRNSHVGIQWLYPNLSNVVIGNNIIMNISSVGISTRSSGRILDNLMYNNSCCISTFWGYNLTITGNTLINSNMALEFIYAGFINPDLPEPNYVWSNNFINNSRSLYNYVSMTILNSDYPIGGNYWSEYNGTDMYSGPYQNESGSDGIADTPYIPDNNPYAMQHAVDYYPLMHPIPEFPSFLILPLFFITTLLAVIVYRRRHLTRA